MRDGLGWVVRESLCKRTGKLGKRIFQAEGTAAVKILRQEMTLKDLRLRFQKVILPLIFLFKKMGKF